MLNKNSKKMENIKITNHFIQIDTILGFEYLDKIGEIINKFNSEKTSVTNFAIDNSIRELLILKPKDNIDEFRINHQKLWINGKNNKIKENANYFAKTCSNIIDIIKVSKINRIGFRTYLTIEQEEGKKEILDEIILQKNKISNFSIIFNSKKINKNKYTSDIKISSAIDNINNKSLILLDIDTYQKSEINKKDIEKKIKEMADFISSNNFISEISNYIKNE